MTALIDIKAVKAAAAKEIAGESAEKAKTALIAQMRRVETAKQMLRAEETKLADLEQRIEDGQL